ncbi:hypothetical protein L2E82_43546 [Cichorium intybus]|uniref:Uncharacterized protein n=1 Tax=Cichorium intybus TaxID=13427 RepID=A0ACB8ZMW7_CICIN|nr:hypothetical protein L2E82_43546 [Cichorium intybus]
MESSTKPRIRSISLPSKLTPFPTRIKDDLNKLKTLVPLSSSVSNQSSFVCLVDLYLSVDNLLGSSRIQQVYLDQCKNKVLVEDVLVGSTGLLDSCSGLLEFLALMKKNIRTLQSALRRKGIAIDASSEAHILDYVLYRKKAKKNMLHHLRSLKKMEREAESCSVSGEDHHLSTVIGVLREIVTATISVFRALFFCLSGKGKLVKRFSLISKLMQTSRPNCDKTQEITTDVDMIDVTLHSLRKSIKNNDSKSIDVRMVKERLLNLDHQIEGYEVGLHTVFRRLIQTRVFLLNILGN